MAKHSHSLKNPVKYLTDRVAQSGKSGSDGVYLLGATVVADPSTIQGSSSDYEDFFEEFTATLKKKQSNDYNSFVLAVIDGDKHGQYMAFVDYWGQKNCSVYAITEDSQLNLHVILSEADVEHFHEDLLVFKYFIEYLSSKAGLRCGTVRFFLNRTYMGWNTLEQTGYTINPKEDVSF